MASMNGISSGNLLQTLMNQADSVSSAKAARSNPAGSTVTAGTMTAQDSAQVSTTASALLQTAGNDDVRAEKVQSIQAAINNGTYSVSSSAVADKLMQHLLR